MDIYWHPGGDIAQDDTGDILAVNGDEENLQDIAQAMTTWQGEWAYDLDYGMDWTRIVRMDPVDEDQIRSLIRVCLARVAGGQAVKYVAVSVDMETRKLTWSAEVAAGLLAGEVPL